MTQSALSGGGAAVNVLRWPHDGPPPLGRAAFTQQVREARATAELRRSVHGALLYLDDTQIRDRDGRHSSLYDYCAPRGETCDSVILINSLGGNYVQRDSRLLGLSMSNRVGEWANAVHFLPTVLGDPQGEVGVAIQDSNVFVTAGILYPLYFIDDGFLAEDQRLAARMRRLAAASLAGYRRGPAYGFWTEIPGQTSPSPRTGPPNLPIERVRRLAAALSGPLFPLWSLVTAGHDVDVEDWVRRALDVSDNPGGFDAIFNLPNDADDTAMVVAMQLYHSRLHPEDRIRPDLPALRRLSAFTDRRRRQHDPRNAAAGQVETGAFLTWLSDEDAPTFGNPRAGVMPLGVNNVDCVVNANAVFALAVNGARHWQGYAGARALLLRAVETRAWAGSCVLYYPQLMMLPYALTRAYREGGLSSDREMRGAMQILLRDLLSLQAADGSFPGGADRTRDLSTALAANALLNIGSEAAQQMGLFNAYQDALARAVHFLVQARRTHDLAFSTPYPGAGETGFRWDSGVFFSGSYGDLAHWRSEAYTTAIALEALAKFLLAYDVTDATLLRGDRLRIDPAHMAVAGEWPD